MYELELQKFELEKWKLFGSVVVFVIALWQYYVAQRWKRHEYFSNQVQKFKDDHEVQLSLQMLDWYTRKLRLKDESLYLVTPKRFRKIVCDERTADRDDIQFSSAEAELRDAFSSFLSWIDKFGADVEAKLVDAKTLNLYPSQPSIQMKTSFINMEAPKPQKNSAKSATQRLTTIISTMGISNP